MQTEKFKASLPSDMKAFIALRAKLKGCSSSRELRSMLEIFMDSDPCTEIEIGKDRGRYVIRSHHSAETFRSFRTKDLAFAAAQTALSEAGLDPANVIDMTGEESTDAG